MSLEQTIDNLQIRNANMVTFVGTSNTMVDTTTGRIQTKGIQHNSNVITDVSGPHGRIGPTLKKYPEIAFAEGKFDSNPTTNMYVQAGYTVSASGKFDENFTVWTLFDESEAGEGSGGCWIDSPNTTYAKEANDAYGGLVGNVLSTVHTTNTLKLASNTPVGAWFTIELPNSIKLDNIQMRPRSASVNIANQSFPKEFGIWGYDGNVWTLIKSVTGHQANYQTIYEPKYTKTNVNATTPYKKYGFVITRTNAVGGSNASDRNFVAIGALKLYGYEEDPPAGDHSVDTTFKSRFNNPQTTGVQVLVDGATGVGTNQISGGPDPSGNQSTYVTDGKYWTLNGTLTSNLAVEANTFLEGDQPHSVSVWFNSSNLEANVSNTCVFSIASEEKLDSQNLDLQSNTWHNLTYAYQGEGGSRVTYLDGRKVSEDQAEDTFGDYPPFAMTGYSQGGYVVSASSENSSFPAHEAFKDFPQSQNERWQTNRAYTSAGLPHTDSPTTLTYKGEWIQLEQPYKLKINYLKMQAHSQVQHQPENWVILGSNDGTIWEFIKERLDASSFNVDSNGYHINTDVIDSPKFYKYHRIVITKSGATAGTEQPIVVGISLYGHRENDLVRLPDPTNVLKYPHITMTGPAQRGYVASASSTYDENYNPWEAFDDQTSTTTGTPLWGYWSSIAGSFSTSSPFLTNRSGSPYVTSVSGTPYTGEWLQLELPHKLKVNSIKYKPRVTGGMPRTGVVAGSNDGTSWVQIFTYQNLSASTLSTATDLTPNSSVSTSAFKYIRIIMTHANGAQYASAQDVQIYGTGVESIPIQIGGGNIDKVANFRVYDRFIEEDQVNEIWNAQKEEFGRAKPQMVLQQGKLGIGTDAPQGSLSVADEPNELEEFPPRGMTSSETHIEGHGVFKVSVSEYTGQGAHHDGWNVFAHGGAEIWLIGNNAGYNTTSGEYEDNEFRLSSETSMGQWIKLEMPYLTNVTKFILQPRTPGAEYQAPKSGELWGSKDNYTWTKLHTFTDIQYYPGHTTFNFENSGFYKYYGLVVTKVVGGNASNDYLGMVDLRYFGTREHKQSVLQDGQLTLTKSLNVPRIGPDLDVDNTPRRDRLVVEYNTSTNPAFNGAVRDTSGRGNHGVIYGHTHFSEKIYDATEKALIFGQRDSPDDYIQTRLNNPAGDWVHSFSFWFKANDLGTSSRRDPIQIGPGDGIYGASLYSAIDMYNNSINWYFYSNDYGTTPTIANERWYHLCCTYEGGGVVANRHIYLNGTEISSASTGGSTVNLTANSMLSLGGDLGRDAAYFKGYISNFKLYDVALTPEEVKTLYDMGRCDEDRHVVNFSKTRVGIGLGDGEAPQATLDVRGDLRVTGTIQVPLIISHRWINADTSVTDTNYIPYNSVLYENPPGIHSGTIFTCPVKGVYECHFASMTDNNGTYSGNHEWYINGTYTSPRRRGYAFNDLGSVHKMGSSHYYIECNSGDTIGVVSAGNQTWYGDSTYSHSHMSIRLITPT